MDSSAIFLVPNSHVFRTGKSATGLKPVTTRTESRDPGNCATQKKRNNRKSVTSTKVINSKRPTTILSMKLNPQTEKCVDATFAVRADAVRAPRPAHAQSKVMTAPALSAVGNPARVVGRGTQQRYWDTALLAARLAPLHSNHVPARLS